ncbi:MAG: putative PilT protein domain protein [Candidatus Aminicenantes bacterium]|nr:putative PilT protein domain protein [Candidatus Aminicenantes bacterium]
MSTWFIDANVFLRFFTVDEQGQHERAVRLISKAREGKIRLVCGPPVLFELSWTLRSAYKVARGKVLEILSAVYSMPGLIMTDSRLVETALTLADTGGVEFPDAYIAASALAEECDGVASFNRKDFARMKIRLADFEV